MFHPHYLTQLNSSENHKSQPWQMLFGDLETAAVLNHLEITNNLYLTVALYYNVYYGVKAQHFPQYATITLIMSQENIMMLSLFFMVIDLAQLLRIQHNFSRTKGITGVKVYFTQNTPFKTKKEQILSNSDNKQDFIFMLSRCLEENGCNTIHAKGDADVLIVMTAVKCAENREAALIGEDTVLLVLLCYHANLQTNRIFVKSEPKQRLSPKA